MKTPKLPKIKWVPFYFVRTLLSLYVKFVEGVVNIDYTEATTLLTMYSSFQQKKSRLIIAFRHPTKHDPALLMYILNKRLKKAGREKDIVIGGKTHAYILYGSWVLNWANNMVKWLFPGIGAIPVSTKGNNLKSIKTIRTVLTHGKYPLVLAPEAQVTYHNGKCGELEPGVISMARWCADDLKRLNKKQEVVILPLTIYYDYGKDIIEKENHLKKIKKMIVKELNFRQELTNNHFDDLILLTNVILEIIRCKFNISRKAEQKSIDEICNHLLKNPETYFGIKRQGSFLDRILTIRECADRSIEKNKKIIKDVKFRNILNFMEVVDILEYIDISYIKHEDTNRYIEYALNLLDILNRLNGGTIATRFSSIHKRVFLISGEPILYNKNIKNKKEYSTLTLEKLYYTFNSISR